MIKVKGKAQGEIECKRLYLPGVVLHEKCPNCGENVTLDLASNYPSDPEANAPVSYSFYCQDGCDHSWSEEVILEINIKAIKK